MSVYFNGTNAYLKRTTNLPTITSATIMGWVHQTSTEIDQVIFAFGDLTTNVEYWILIQSSKNVAPQAFTVYENTGYVTVSTLVIPYTWNHMAITIEGTGVNQVKGYLNGALNITTNGNVGPSAQAIFIGTYGNGSGGFYPGSMAGVKIYSNALDATAIADEYAKFHPVRTADLNGYYPMTDASSVGRDDSGNGNDFTVGGQFQTAFLEPFPTVYTPKYLSDTYP